MFLPGLDLKMLQYVPTKNILAQIVEEISNFWEMGSNS